MGTMIGQIVMSQIATMAAEKSNQIQRSLPCGKNSKVGQMKKKKCKRSRGRRKKKKWLQAGKYYLVQSLIKQNVG